MKLILKILLFTWIPNVLIAKQGNQDTTLLTEVIVDGSRLQIPISKYSRNIQIIDNQEIGSLPAVSINEALTYLNGIDVRQRGPFGTQADISIDGGTFDQSLILINGIKISDIQTGHHSMNIPIILNAVKRIEVLRGPAARVYGINALAGAINIITIPESENNYSIGFHTGSSFTNKEVGDGSGIYGGYSGFIMSNFGTEKFRNFITLGLSKSNGQRYNSQTKNTKLFYHSRYSVDQINEVDMQFGIIDNAFGANGYYAWPGDKESFEIVKSLIGSIRLNSKIGNKITLKPRLAIRKNSDDYRFYRNDLSIGRSEHQTYVYTFDVNSLLHTDIGDFGFGWESRSERIESSNLGDHKRFNNGLFTEFKTQLSNILYATTGAYINFNTKYGWQVFPGIDFSYILLDKIKASFSVGSSQRVPTYTDLYINQPKNIGSPELKPENAMQYELLFRYFNDKSSLQIGYFNRQINDFIDWVADSPELIFKARNLEGNRVHGLHLNGKQKSYLKNNSQLNLNFSYNYLMPKQRKYEDGFVSKYILENLKHQLIANTNYTLDNISIMLANRWVKRELNKAYLISDCRLGYSFSKFKINADINNLFDHSYSEIGSVLLPKRWFSLGLSWESNFK